MKTPSSKEQSLLFKIVGKAAKWFGRDEVPDVFKVLAVNNRLFWAWLYFASRLMPYGKLSGRERELVILRVAWLCRCRYEWGQHIEVGLKNGLSNKDVVSVSVGASAFLDEKEKGLMLACDELINHQHISENTWQLLSRFYSEKMLIEISMLIGNYQMLAGYLNSVGLKLEPSAEIVMQEFHASIK
ncbi:MAG: carboxymuconolactone decarboxylase family protein [Flavobacteriales bacterium]|nr:carboxymuconolactone decarboxylase family protein [Flavobacteriales bacterium]